MLLQTLRQIASSFGSLESFDLRQPEPAEDGRGEPRAPNVAVLSKFDYRRIPDILVSPQCG